MTDLELFEQAANVLNEATQGKQGAWAEIENVPNNCKEVTFYSEFGEAIYFSFNTEGRLVGAN